jgi:hypothetical protein
MIPLTIDDVNSHMSSCDLDHRLYGKLLEDFIGTSIIVFTIDGIIPYRCSPCNKSKFILLYMSEGKYDRIIVPRDINVSRELIHIRNIVNRADNVRYQAVDGKRPIDYTFTYIRLISYLARMLSESNIHIVYVKIDETVCMNIVEKIYHKNIYYECVVKSVDAKYDNEIVSTRKREHIININMDHLLSTLDPLIKQYDKQHNKIYVYSPVDMSKYNKWNFTLEDCLYYSPCCYSLDDKEEVQYITLV